MKIALLLPVVALLVQEPHGPGQDPGALEAQDPARITRALVEVCSELAEKPGIDGISVAVGFAEKPLLARGWGYADAGRAVAAAGGTQVRLGRLTDLFTAVAVMRLVEQERLALDAKIADLLPAFPLQGRDLRVHHLLDHTSGLPPYKELPAQWAQRGREGTAKEEILALFQGRPFLFEPGARHEESNANATLLALVVESVAGVDFTAQLRRSVLAPAGIYRTEPCDKGEEAPEQTEPEAEPATPPPAGGGVPLPASYAFGTTDVLSTEELCSNAEDLYRFTRALHDGDLLEEASLRRLEEPVKLADGSASEHGPILRRDEHDGLVCWVDSGEQVDDRIVVAHYPTSHLTVVVMGHGVAAGREGLTDALRQKLARTALSVPEPGVVDLEVEAELVPRLVGAYMIGTTRAEVRVRGKHLLILRPREPDLELLYQGELRFVSTADHGTQVQFHLPDDDEGPAQRFVVREKGFETTGVRLD